MTQQRDTDVFLEPRSYRRRRVLDGAKLLPVLGAWLFMLPLFWPEAGAHANEPKPMSSALLYIFGVWLALTVLSAAVILLLGKRRPSKTETPPEQT